MSKDVNMQDHPWVVAQREHMDPVELAQLDQEHAQRAERRARRAAQRDGTLLVPRHLEEPDSDEEDNNREPLHEITATAINSRQYKIERRKKHREPLLVDRSPDPPPIIRDKPPMDAETARIREEICQAEREDEERRLRNLARPRDRSNLKLTVGPWEIGRQIGEGSHGQVRKAVHRVTHEVVAIKVVNKHSALTTDIGSLVNFAAVDAKAREKEENLLPLMIEREVAILKLISHPSIVKLHDVWESNAELYLVFEYVEQDLCEFLANHHGGMPLDERHALFLFRQIMQGVSYLHDLNICHRDIKCENILIANGGIIKLADFGLAALKQSPDYLLTTWCGSPLYASPELVLRKGYDGIKSDVWAMGIVLYVLLTLDVPFQPKAIDVEETLKLIIRGKYTIPAYFSRDLRHFITSMLEPNPQKRITVKEMFDHPVIKIYENIDDIYTMYNLYQPPSLEDRIDHSPVHPDEVDPFIFRQLGILWHNSTDEELQEMLVNDDPTDAKVFYWMLYSYREKTLKNPILNVPHSPSEIHHIRPGIQSRRVRRTQRFQHEDGKGYSQFSVTTNVAVPQAPGQNKTQYAESAVSYDPYRSAPYANLHASRTKITIHRNEPETHVIERSATATSMRGSRSPDQGARHSRAGSIHSQRRYAPRSPSSMSVATMATSATTTTTQGRGRNRRVPLRPKRNVQFPRVRQQNSPNPSPVVLEKDGIASTTVTGDQETKANGGTPSAAAVIPGGLASLEKARDRALRIAENSSDSHRVSIDDEELRQFSTSIAQDLDEAFKSSVELPSPSSSPPRFTGLPTQKTMRDFAGNGKRAMSVETFGPPLDMSTPRGSSTGHLFGGYPHDRRQESYQPMRGARTRPVSLPLDAHKYANRPLPPAPPKSESVLLEIMRAKENAESRHASGFPGDSTEHVHRIVDHLNRLVRQPLKFKISESRWNQARERVVSAPADSRTRSPSKRRSMLGEKRLSAGKIESSTRDVINDGGARHISAPVQSGGYDSSMMSSDPISREHKGLSYLAKAENTIRVVNSPGNGTVRHGRFIYPSQIPKPLNIRKRDSHRAASLREKHLVLKQKEEEQEQEETRHHHSREKVIYPHHMAQVVDAHNKFNSSLLSTRDKGKRSWFRRPSSKQDPSSSLQTYDDKRQCLSPTDTAAITEAESKGWEAYSNSTGPFGAAPMAPPMGFPKRSWKESLFPLWFLHREKLGHEDANTGMVIAGPEVSDTPSIRPPMMKLPGGRYANGSSSNYSGWGGLDETADGRQVDVQQSWLAKLFKLDPATRCMCFRVSRRQTRKELTGLLKDWRKYGIRSLEVDKSRSIIFARVGRPNYLDIKPISFAIEISMVKELGTHNPLAIARFMHEGGSCSSFHKVFETLTTVMTCRKLLVPDKNKCRMMTRTLTSLDVELVPSKGHKKATAKN
ncbi:hypothetical protein MKZ38_001271 [Zalerion maritima]|uniref:non-specific serine/threonine protein kinase n=1 Tax=Zalerion maritima TaxID=339359 RepID=A0AAD5WRL7_9PEZI|nr:hypothetical protein MKZ38_001271 [Zalerion maritima]